MKYGRPVKVKVKVYARAVVAIMLITVWSLVALTGLLLWLAPSGPRSGQQLLLLEMTKHEWGDVHFWIAVAVVVVTVVHLIIDWRALRGLVRYLTSVHRSPRVLE
ncbi:unnamed protein product [marine sediment metagenome]|uniref:Flavinylation-associated cytochrome domain-containing protein n=1 Tax=marine sediment metagenome TaxID=412755 RepID=X1K5R6_9ZZZZ